MAIWRSVHTHTNSTEVDRERWPLITLYQQSRHSVLPRLTLIIISCWCFGQRVCHSNICWGDVSVPARVLAKEEQGRWGGDLDWCLLLRSEEFHLRKMQMDLELILFKNVSRHSEGLFFPSYHGFSNYWDECVNPHAEVFTRVNLLILPFLGIKSIVLSRF